MSRKECEICKHPHREEIEAALFRMSGDGASSILNKIAAEYDVPVEALQAHSLFHTSFDCEPGGDSIVRQIKMREADMLASMALDQLETVKAVGKRMRRFAEASDEEDIRFEKTLTKPMVDLYIGAGDGLRKNVQTIADINHLLNGPKDEGLSGLTALAQVLNESRKEVTHSEDETE